MQHEQDSLTSLAVIRANVNVQGAKIHQWLICGSIKLQGKEASRCVLLPCSKLARLYKAGLQLPGCIRQVY